jgi:hypothetical protein
MSVYIDAARSPPRSLPAKSHAFLPSAISRSACSAALLLRQIRPWAQKLAVRELASLKTNEALRPAQEVLTYWETVIKDARFSPFQAELQNLIDELSVLVRVT